MKSITLLKLVICGLVLIVLCIFCASCTTDNNEPFAPHQLSEQTAVTELTRGNGDVLWAVRTDLIDKNGASSIFSLSEEGWQMRYSPDDSINEMCKGAEDNMCACGGKGIYLFDGSVWSLWYESNEAIAGISAPASNDIWAVGMEGGIYHYDGQHWGQEENVGIRLVDIDAIDKSNIWVIGNDMESQIGVFYYYNGSDWSTDFKTGEIAYLCRISALDSQHIYVTNLNGPGFFYDGTKWESNAGYFDEMQITSVEALDSSFVLFAGGHVRNPLDENDYNLGVVYLYDGDEWIKQFETDSFVSALDSLDGSDVWIGMRGGVVMHYLQTSLVKSYVLE